MKILSLEINNFGPIEHAHLALDDRGLVNIEGVNRDDPSADSNGSGKSTIPDALYWGMFGETARGVSGDDVISSFAGKNCSVAVHFEEGDDTFKVERWRKCKGKGKASGLSLDLVKSRSGLPADLTQGTDKLTQAKIEAILGCSQEVFTKAVYSGQEALPDLPRMTDKQIKELVEEAAGIEILTKAYELAKKHRTTLERASSDATRTVADGEAWLQREEHGLTNCQEKHDAWRGEQDTKIANATTQLTNLVTKARGIADEMGKIDVPALNAAVTDLQARVDAVAGEQSKLASLAGAVSKVRSAVAASGSTLTAKLAEMKRAQDHLTGISGKVGSPCGECGKSYAAEDLGEATRLATERALALRQQALGFKTDYETAKAAETAAQKEHDDYRGTMTDVSATIADMQAKNREIQKHGALSNDLTSVRNEAQRVKDRIDELKAEENPFVDMLLSSRQAVTQRTDSLTKSRETLALVSKDLMIAEAAVSAFGPTGVRAYVLDTVTPYLNSRTAHYLGTLSDGRIEAIWTTLATNSKGELVEKFCIEVAKQGGGQSFKALSGGEKRKVRLSCALALQDLVSSRASKPISLWIGDEIDDALDESGLERLMDVLKEKAREKGTVLVISHNSLADHISETLTVTMEAGKSTLSGALV